jgi:hypothetical protein
LLKHLEPDQAAFTKAALEAVQDRQAEILEELRLSPPAEIEASNRPEDILRPLPEHAGPEPTPSETSARKSVRFNSGRPVFRVPRRARKGWREPNNKKDDTA